MDGVVFAIPGDELPLDQAGLDELLVALDEARDRGDAGAGRAVEAVRDATWKATLEQARPVLLGDEEQRAVCRVLRDAQDAKRLSPALRIFEARFCRVPVLVGDRRLTVPRDDVERLAGWLRARPDGDAAAEALVRPTREGVRLDRGVRTLVAAELRQRRAAGEPLDGLDDLARLLAA